jgi:hypothetical protein
MSCDSYFPSLLRLEGIAVWPTTGVAGDAIPVVSAQWFSQDDALLRVAQGIRRIAEKWRAGKTTLTAQVADTSIVSMPPAICAERARDNAGNR